MRGLRHFISNMKKMEKLNPGLSKVLAPVFAKHHPRGSSRLEFTFDSIWKALNGPALEKEVKFHPTRKWRFDRAHVATMTAIEIEGGIWANGRHTRGSGYAADCLKYNAAQHLGWRVFRITQPSASEIQQIIDTINKT